MALINKINKEPELRYIVIVKVLTEVERIIENCPAARFTQPISDKYGSKQAHFHELLKNGENIVITHELFSRLSLTGKERELINKNDYHLVIDEVPEVIEPLNISPYDRTVILERFAMIEDNGMVKWINRDYTGKYSDIKRMMESKAVFISRETTFLWLFPIDLIKSFKKVTVMTFLFESSHMKHYLDIYGLKYRIWHIKDGVLMEGRENLTSVLPHFRKLINIYDGKLNDIGNNLSLSHTCQTDPKNRKEMKQLRNNAYNFLRRHCNKNQIDWLWTQYKGKETKDPKLRENVSPKCFCSSNATAINRYGTRHSLAYLINVYQHPGIVTWFRDQGVELDEDALALSQMIQWIWRSAIRNNEPINIYIPSKRMRNILISFLETGQVGSIDTQSPHEVA